MSDNPVLLVHGFASSFERNWREPGWVDLLKEAGRDVVAVDLLGHGTSEKPHDPQAYAHLEEQVAAVLPDARQLDAVGFSLGARLLLTVAARRPEQFERIVVGGVGANLFRVADPEPIARAIEGGPAAARAAEDEDADAAGIGNVARLFVQFAEGSGNDRAALAACLRRPERPLTAADLGSVSCPVLVVLGDRDFAGPAEPLLEALPDARLVTLKGVDHFAAPRHFGFLDAALEFLGAVPA